MNLNRFVHAAATSFIAAVFGSTLALAAGGALGPNGGEASAGLFTSNPPLVISGADPFLMIDLSVELTQQAEAFTDASQTFANGTLCKGRLFGQPWNGGTADYGICYTAAETYIGYFDSEKCYTYDTTGANTKTDQLATGPRSDANPHFFKPAGKATNHVCSGKFSGNFLNWATMTALDEFRGAMTGGARLVDTAGSSAQTLLTRTRRFDSWSFVLKAINSGGLTAGGATFTTNPTSVTPFAASNFTQSTGSSTTPSCSCDVSNANNQCTRQGQSNRNPSSCTCQRTVAVTYPPGPKSLVVANNWNGLGVGTSLHRTRFYALTAATTTTTTTIEYKRSGYTCPKPVTVTTATATEQTPLTVGGQTDINVIVKVCDPTAANGGLEANCTQYTDGTNTWYKPEGLVQKNALKMKYALSSYTGRDGNGINGGVLRSNAKYVGAQMPTINGGLQDNPNAEVGKNGVMVFDPDKLAGKVGLNSVAPVNSGILNYINQFGLAAGRYKSNDPDAELYYEGLRYMMNLGPTGSFYGLPKAGSGITMTQLSAAEQDGFPIFGANTAGSPAWKDPFKSNPYDDAVATSSCQKSFALYVGDKNTHKNNYIPGGYSMGTDPACTGDCTDAVAKGINAGALVDAIGAYETGFDKTTSRGSSEAGYGLAGMAWWANTHDIRTDLGGNQRLKTFIVDTQEYGSSTPVGKNNILWMAAKWGGFEESNKTNYDPADNNVVAASTALGSTPKPDVISEWNARGAVYTDGTRLPDTYTLASQPANLVSGLTQVFAAASTGSASASAAAVVANNAFGVASLYQALYEPQLTNGGVGVGWTGLVRSFFLDDEAQVREDSNGDGALTDADAVVKYKSDPSNPAAVVADLFDVEGLPLETNVSIRDLKPIWNAAERLSDLSASSIPTQRAYGANTNTGRYIRTWVDNDRDGIVDTGEEIDFTAANFPAFNAASNDSNLDNGRLLGLDSSNGNLAPSIVNYVRGLEISGMRNRTIDMGDGKGPLTRRLGDIVHSSPLVVGAPAQNYDVNFGDTTYAAFKSQYANRRSVVYVGANDGMLHAFNAGFFDPATKSYSSSDSQPLGGELWAYVPYNLLPHVRWLTDPLYRHMFFVDGSPQSFDVNVFADDADHPGGWGTILVVGFRMGGGEITVNGTTDQTGAADAGNRTMRPSYLVFDITNPEKPPELMGEINDQYLTAPSNMGHTISRPTVVKHRVISSGVATANKWFLVMGNGPAGRDAAESQIAHDKAVSFRPARAFLYDLAGGSALQRTPAIAAVSDGSSFVGDMAPMDWNKDYTDEVIYFGTVGNTDTADPKGNLWRMVMPAGFTGSPTFSMVLSGNSSNQPFSAAPLPTLDKYNRPWVYAGTGRFYTSNDVLSAKPMSYYGIREGTDLTQSIAKSNLVNTTGIRVSAITEKVSDASNTSPFTLNGQSVSTFPQLLAAVDSASGWYINLDPPQARSIDRSLAYLESVLFIVYQASNDSCSPAGSSRLFAPNQLTGTASPFHAIGADPTVRVGLTESASAIAHDLGSGLAQIAGMYKNRLIGSISDSRSFDLPIEGPVTTARNGRTSWRELPLPNQ